jgi:uncharacterized protein YxjI
MLFGRRRGGPPAEAGPEQRIGTRFVMRQKMFSFGDDFTVTDEQGRKVFSVDGKMFRLRDTLLFKDAEGREIYKIQEKLLRVRDSMDVKRDGEVVAHVHQALYTPLRDRFQIDLAGGGKLLAKGNFLYHEYRILRGDWPALDDTVPEGTESGLTSEEVRQVAATLEPGTAAALLLADAVRGAALVDALVAAGLIDSGVVRLALEADPAAPGGF